MPREHAHRHDVRPFLFDTRSWIFGLARTMLQHVTGGRIPRPRTRPSAAAALD
jgi:hypothetical protein